MIGLEDEIEKHILKWFAEAMYVEDVVETYSKIKRELDKQVQQTLCWRIENGKY